MAIQDLREKIEDLEAKIRQMAEYL